MTRWVVGTQNRHKLDEIGAIVAPLGITLVTPAELGVALDVVEDGGSFAANAALKALAWARYTGLTALADDSGLEVDGLDGAPGVDSAVYAGTHGDDAANNARLVRELEQRGLSRSTARYRCVIAVARPERAIDAALRTCAVTDLQPTDHARVDGFAVALWEGTMEGAVVTTPRGLGGFGYDPYFGVDDGRALAELAAAEKNAISHRGAALRAMAAALRASAPV